MPGFYLPTKEEFDPHTDDFVQKFVSKERRYQHFDLPIPQSQRQKSYDFRNEVKPHRFFPLLGYTDEVKNLSGMKTRTEFRKLKNDQFDLLVMKMRRIFRLMRHILMIFTKPPLIMTGLLIQCLHTVKVVQQTYTTQSHFLMK